MIFQDVLELSANKCDVSPTVEKAKKPNRTIKKPKDRFVDSMYTFINFALISLSLFKRLLSDNKKLLSFVVAVTRHPILRTKPLQVLSKVHHCLLQQLHVHLRTKPTKERNLQLSLMMKYSKWTSPQLLLMMTLTIFPLCYTLLKTTYQPGKSSVMARTISCRLSRKIHQILW